MTSIIIVGSKGRMGQMLLACAARAAGLRVTGQIDLGDDLAAVLPAGDVVIDFSLPEATAGVASLCAQHRKPLVIGTTGHSPTEKSRITDHASRIPMVWSVNYRPASTPCSARPQGRGDPWARFDLEIVEMHHRLKRDAPSGTAARLAEILAEVRHQQLTEVARHGRQGQVGERTAAEIGIHAVRGGDVVGDHTVIFAANGER
jgi:4-hydroxy-tetrahydrodipicolinate reductase